MMNVIFRVANYDDIENIIDLCNMCFDESTDIDYAKKIFKENEHDKNQIYIVGEINGEIIAHCKINIIPTIYQKMNTYAILNHVCVNPKYRRHNIATKMLDECFKICKERKCVSVELWSMNFRVAAHACYKNYGFKVQDCKFFAKDI